MATTIKHDVKDLALTPEGVRRIEWADRQMPVLAAIRERFEREQPLAGYRVSACLHVTTETANLMRTLKAGGAEVVLCASNPLSTQDDVAAALVEEYGIGTFAIKGEDHDTYYAHLEAAIDHRPARDDGRRRRRDRHPPLGPPRAARRRDRRHRGDDDRGDPAPRARARRQARLPGRRRQRGQARSTCSTTATGRASRRSTGSSGPRTSCSPVARSSWPATAGAAAASRCGRRGIGAHVIVTEVDAMKALEAVMDGFQVMPMAKAAEVGDIFVTATGDKHVISREHIERLKDGAILANTGHFNVEIDIPALRSLATDTREARAIRRGVHARQRAQGVPPRRGATRQPRGGRGPSRSGDGHVVREPGVRRRVRDPERRLAGAEGVRRPEGDRRRDRAPQARDDGRRDRRADARSRPPTWRAGTRGRESRRRRRLARRGT